MIEIHQGSVTCATSTRSAELAGVLVGDADDPGAQRRG